MHIKAAVYARNESGSDTVIVARTDPHQALCPDEALWRVQARPSLMLELTFYLLMPLPQEKKWRHFVLLHLEFQKMANMLEGGGKIPKLSLVELDEIGYKIIAYPLSLNLIGVSMRAMEDALNAVKGGRLPPPGSLPSFNEIKDTLEFNRYYEEEKRYIVTPTQSSLRTAPSAMAVLLHPKAGPPSSPRYPKLHRSSMWRGRGVVEPRRKKQHGSSCLHRQYPGQRRLVLIVPSGGRWRRQDSQRLPLMFFIAKVICLLDDLQNFSQYMILAQGLSEQLKLWGLNSPVSLLHFYTFRKQWMFSFT